MAYQVVKRIRGRDYRYQVEAYRDPVTGKSRAHWTYLGRSGTAEPAAHRKPARDTRDRLLGAFERLLEHDDYLSISVGAIAREAGVAHGTFYRHFADKRGALFAAMDDLRRSLLADRPSLAGALGEAAAERARVASWVRTVFVSKPERLGIVRAWYSLATDDPQMRTLRTERREALGSELTEYLERLGGAGYRRGPAAPIARAILILMDGGVRRVVIDGEQLEPETIEALVTMAVAAAFGAAERATFAGL